LTERDAVAALSLMAAQADGLRPEERTRLGEVFEALGGVDSARLFKDVLLGHIGVDEAVAALTSPGMRAYAFEMAVGACDADGHTSSAERAFLDQLERALGLEHAEAVALLEQAEALADAPLALVPFAAPTEPEPASVPDAAVVRPDLDRLVLNRAIMAGALELLPQSLATMAIVPVQLKTVADVGKAHGFVLDQGSVRELLAIAGVGLTGQVLEGYARKLFGGALRGIAGRAAGALGATATGAVTTFATTYAIGKVADAYYGGGRTLEAVRLKELFARELERGRTLFARHQGDVQQQAATTNLGELTRQLRG
jgi:uncharacterized protein (DUF697 family)/tellurite resistance protein